VGGTIWINPDTTAPVNTSVVTSQNNVVDVSLNGTDYTFSSSTVYSLIFDGSKTMSGTRQVFRNDTSVPSFAMGGAGQNQFTAGHGFDTFVGGAGQNQFTARDGFVFFFGSALGTNDFQQGSGVGIIVTFGKNNRVAPGTGTYYVYAF
jgi:hypothetical protein